MKRCSTSLIIREMQIQTQIEISPQICQTIKKISNKQGNTGNPCGLLLRMQTRTATMENSIEVSQKLRIELPYFTSILLTTQRIQNNINMHLYIHCSIFLNKNQDLEATCLSMDKNIKVLCSLYIYIDI